jgi:4-hydroxybenzoate polyprenyltransferase
MSGIKRFLVHIRWSLQSFTLLGFLFGMVVSNANFSVTLVFGFISWFFLCASIVVFNSYYDRDAHPVAGLENPPVVTFSLLIGAWLLKLFGFIIALFLNNLFLSLYIMGVILSVLYSHKKFRFKSNGYVAVLFNFIVGATTFMVASSFSSINIESFWCGSAAAGIFLAAIYLMMQVHQKEEDGARQYISIMVLYGRKNTLTLAMSLMMTAAILTLITFVLSGLHWFYILIIMVYFGIILFLNYIWLNKQGKYVSDFKMMNKLTTRLSYAANLILIVVYISEIIIKT